MSKATSSVDFGTGRERRILDKQFFRNEEELTHPRPIDYNAADLKD